MDMIIPPLAINIMLESSALKSSIVVRRLAVVLLWRPRESTTSRPGEHIW